MKNTVSGLIKRCIRIIFLSNVICCFYVPSLFARDNPVALNKMFQDRSEVVKIWGGPGEYDKYSNTIKDVGRGVMGTYNYQVLEKSDDGYQLIEGNFTIE